MLTVVDYLALWQPALCSNQIKIGVCYHRFVRPNNPQHIWVLLVRSVQVGWMILLKFLQSLPLSLCIEQFCKIRDCF